MDKMPHQMTSVEFAQAFPFFHELTPRMKWRCYRLQEKINFEETGETCSYAEFADFAKDFRWDMSSDPRWEGMLLAESDHAYFIRDALRNDWDTPSDVLDEYPDLVEEFLKQKVLSSHRREQRSRQLQKKKEEKEYEKATSKEDRDFWGNF